MFIAASIVIATFATIGFGVTAWCAVRLPFWIRDLRREDRERAWLESLPTEPPTEIPQAAIDPVARVSADAAGRRVVAVGTPTRRADRAGVVWTDETGLFEKLEAQ